jgi:hypothetical protein
MEQRPGRDCEARYLERWRQIRPLLDEIRDRETRSADTAQSIQMMRQAFQIAVRDLPPRDSSGLVEWQRWMARWRQRG